MPYRNIIQDYIDFSGPAGAQVFSVNAADAHIKGIESDVTIAVARGLSLNGSLALNRVHFTRLIVGSPGLDPATCPGVNPVNPAQCQAMRYARAPRTSFTVGADYHTDVPNVGVLSLNANYGYNSRQQSQYSAASSIFLPAFGVLNLRTQIDFENHLSVAVFVTNALGEKYALGGGNGAANNGNVITEVPGRPREFGATFTVNF
jgi:iron complex outermembrane receptor protein